MVGARLTFHPVGPADDARRIIDQQHAAKDERVKITEYQRHVACDKTLCRHTQAQRTTSRKYTCA